MKIPFNVDATAVKSAMEALQKGEPLPPVQVPEEFTKMAVLSVWPHLANDSRFTPAINATICIERHLAQLAALAGTYDPDQLQRNTGMVAPRYNLNDIEWAYVTGELQWLIDEVREYERRLNYVIRRYAMNGKFDLE